MSVRVRALLAALPVALVAIAATGCAPEDEAPTTATTPTTSSSADACTKDQLQTVTAGTFTVGTDKPAYEPWFSDDDPTNGKGYESAVAYAVADRARLRAGGGQVDRGAVHQRVRPGRQEVRRRHQPGLDHRGPPQGRRLLQRLLRRGPDRRHHQGLPDRRRQDASPSSRTPSSAPRSAPRPTPRSTSRSSRRKKAAVYDTNDLAVQALKNGQIDGLVVDLPTAFYMAAAQLDDGVDRRPAAARRGHAGPVRDGAGQGQRR